MHAVHKAGQHGHNSPGNQNASNPDACSNSVQQQITGDFKEEITEKENTGEQTELLVGDAQVFIHRQCCESNIGPVEIGNNVQKKEKGKNPDPHFPKRSGLDGHRAGAYFVAHTHLGCKSAPAGKFHEQSWLVETMQTFAKLYASKGYRSSGSRTCEIPKRPLILSAAERKGSDEDRS